MPKYVRRAEVVEAIKNDGSGMARIQDWLADIGFHNYIFEPEPIYSVGPGMLRIRSKHSTTSMPEDVFVGDYIVLMHNTDNHYMFATHTKEYFESLYFSSAYADTDV